MVRMAFLALTKLDPLLSKNPMISLAHVVEIDRREGQGKAVRLCDSFQLSISGELLKLDAGIA